MSIVNNCQNGQNVNVNDERRVLLSIVHGPKKNGMGTYWFRVVESSPSCAREAESPIFARITAS